MHTEQKCANKKNGIIGKQMNGCPSLALLADCELKPEQSWCFINESSCFEQIKKQNWSYCEPATQATMLPYCECEPFWKGDEKAADGTTKNVRPPRQLAKRRPRQRRQPRPAPRRPPAPPHPRALDRGPAP